MSLNAAAANLPWKTFVLSKQSKQFVRKTPFYSFNTSGKIQNDGGSTYYVVLPTLTGLTRTGIPGNIHFPKGKYLQTDNSGGLMLTQGITGNSSSSGLSGYRVGLQRITFADTGVIVGSSYYIPDTITNLTTAGTGNSSKYTLADFEVDVSYTGDTKRVLIGYMGITGATSGNLCARLAEINGEVITYGDPVVIRSVIPSGALRQSISITYHSSGLDTNCFVVATTVDPGNLSFATPETFIRTCGKRFIAEASSARDFLERATS